MKAQKTGNKIFVKRDYSFELNGFLLSYNIKIYDLYDVEYEDERGKYWNTETITIDEFVITDKDIEQEYSGILSDMWKELEETYNITNRKYA
ncbi:hypothetical protein HMPREF2887_05590 [Streptococcus sp. HMSC071H03]|uniref:hypothetical protein n=1 Tax=Streptococcus sp. HMSC071H03 TaxID=1739391 RepID=UPI0008CCDC1B|nr:hypothetical protein [Streptococcus sp. HMSC071H03]OFR41656.1 hypothetical protein HMPREF2887_05590 [Streptococcus sp. HMSC071H03]